MGGQQVVALNSNSYLCHDLLGTRCTEFSPVTLKLLLLRVSTYTYTHNAQHTQRPGKKVGTTVAASWRGPALRQIDLPTGPRLALGSRCLRAYRRIVCARWMRSNVQNLLMSNGTKSVKPCFEMIALILFEHSILQYFHLHKQVGCLIEQQRGIHGTTRLATRYICYS